MEEKEPLTVTQWIDRLSNTINCIPWEADAQTWQFTYVGPQAVKMLGYPIDRWYEDGFWANHIYDKDREATIDLCRESSKVLESYEFEYRMIASDGRLVWLHDVVTVESVEGTPKILRGFMIDITERKEKAQALQRSERRFREVTAELSKSQQTLSEAQRLAHIGSWEYDMQNRTVMVSDEYYRILGIPQGSEVTPESFLAAVHPDDVEYVKAKIAEGLSKYEPYTIDHRIVLPSGEVRFVQDETRVYFDDAGNPVRKVGTVHDVTDSKQAALKVQQAEEQLRALSRHLIQAQETERRRIALELHDQLSQDLALISIELEDLIQKSPESPAQPMERLQKLAVQARKLSSQVQTLSHQLHPSQLTHLGLVAASRSLCSEVSKASGIRIDFGHSKVPNTIPQDISVCLFRVLQESLGNVARHSEAREAQVTLTGGPSEIQLDVSDSGVGFDPHSHQDSFGLGLIGMQERLLSTGGELIIDSQPRAGARIMARVPLTAASVKSKALQT
jgi:PAS domain S-box-containing protein